MGNFWNWCFIFYGCLYFLYTFMDSQIWIHISDQTQLIKIFTNVYGSGSLVARILNCAYFKELIRFHESSSTLFKLDKMDKMLFVLCLIAQLCPTFCDPMDCSPLGSSVHGDSPGKNTGVPSSKGSSQPRNQTQDSHTAGQILYHLSHQQTPRILEWVA